MGSPLVEHLSKWELSEDAINCHTCKVSEPLFREEFPRPYKCCTFQPFWSAFLVGAYLIDNPAYEPSDNNVLLPVGIIPPAPKRELQFRLDRRSRAQSEELKCSHYGDQGCRIYNSRPIECRRYFCSGSSPVKTQYRNMIFETYLWLQAKLLEEFTLMDFVAEDLAQWTDFLEADGFNRAPHKAFTSWEEAKDYYLRAHHWLVNRAPEIEWPDFPVLEKWHEQYRRTPTEIG